MKVYDEIASVVHDHQLNEKLWENKRNHFRCVHSDDAMWQDIQFKSFSIHPAISIQGVGGALSMGGASFMVQ